MSLCSFFTSLLFLCLCMSVWPSANAFAKSSDHHDFPKRKIHRRDDVVIASSSSSITTEKNPSDNTSRPDLTETIVSTNGGSAVFPPLVRPIRTEECAANKKQKSSVKKSPTRQFLSTHMATIMAMCLMGFSGVVESICYRRFHVFPNMMTGNTVRAMTAFTSSRWNDMQVPLGMIGSYISGATLYKVLDKAKVFSRNIPNMVWLSATTFVLFGLSDVVGMTSNIDLMRLLPMATAFGMINCATQETTGFVTNAATGHYGKIGFGLGESIAVNLLPRNSAADSRGGADLQIIKYGITSALAMGSFVTTLIITNFIGLWLDAKHPWVYTRLPPLGLSLGAAYAILLTTSHFLSKKLETSA